MRQVVQEWCTTASERLEIHGFIIWRAILPTPIEEANPCEGQGPHSGLMRLALITVLRVIDLCPEGRPDRLSRPCDERLAEERGTLEAPVHPGFLATPFRDRCNPGVFLECIG